MKTKVRQCGIEVFTHGDRYPYKFDMVTIEGENLIGHLSTTNAVHETYVVPLADVRSILPVKRFRTADTLEPNDDAKWRTKHF